MFIFTDNIENLFDIKIMKKTIRFHKKEKQKNDIWNEQSRREEKRYCGTCKRGLTISRERKMKAPPLANHRVVRS